MGTTTIIVERATWVRDGVRVYATSDELDGMRTPEGLCDYPADFDVVELEVDVDFDGEYSPARHGSRPEDCEPECFSFSVLGATTEDGTRVKLTSQEMALVEEQANREPDYEPPSDYESEPRDW